MSAALLAHWNAAGSREYGPWAVAADAWEEAGDADAASYCRSLANLYACALPFECKVPIQALWGRLEWLADWAPSHIRLTYGGPGQVLMAGGEQNELQWNGMNSRFGGIQSASAETLRAEANMRMSILSNMASNGLISSEQMEAYIQRDLQEQERYARFQQAQSRKTSMGENMPNFRDQLQRY
jgi:hypothetical protein